MNILPQEIIVNEILMRLEEPQIFVFGQTSKDNRKLTDLTWKIKLKSLSCEDEEYNTNYYKQYMKKKIDFCKNQG